MRSGIIIAVTALLVAALARPAVAQSDTPDPPRIAQAQSPASPLARRALLQLERVPLGEALERLHRASGVSLFYSPSTLPSAREVSCDCREVTVAEALERMLDGTGVRYAEVGGHVVLEAPRPAAARHADTARLRAVSLEPRLPVIAWAPVVRRQDQLVAGRVVDARTSQPLQSAQVEVVGTGRGTLTGADGRFRITGLRGEEVEVRVTLIGYRTASQTARVGATNLTIALTQSALDLDALVVTGTPGAMEKRAVGTAISTIDASSVAEVAPVRDVSQLITGRAAGALVRSASGALGGGSRITLRGSATLGLNDQPLIYVDGVRVDNTQGAGLPNEGAGVPNSPISRLNDFSPEQIESIEIIKGPAASTLYGTEAANGVIQIITKKGSQDGRTRWDLTVEQGATWFQSPTDRFNLIYGQDAGGQVLTINPVELAEQQGEDPFRTGHLQRYALSLSGGADRFQYFVGGEMNRDQGTDPTQALRQYRGRFNFTLTPSDEIRLNTNIGYLNGRTDTPNDGNFGGPIWAFHNVRPSLLDTQRRGWLFGSPTEWYRGWDFFQDVSRTTIGLQVEHRPRAWFTQRLNLGADLVREDSHQISERMSDDLLLAFGGSLGRGRRTYQTREATNSTVDYGASVDLGLTDRVRSTTSGGVQYYHKSQAAVSGTGTAFPAAGLRTLSATAIRDVGENYIENNTVGLFLQEQLAVNERLYLTGAIRADDNSAFGENFDMVYYPKGSLTWVVSDEPFWGLEALSTLRLRGAFGMSGQQPDVFDALRTFSPVTGPGGVPAVTPTNIGNADLEPERSREIEVGFDAGFLDERIGVELTYYDQRTTDAIVARSLPPSGGFGGVQFVNLGELSNRGLEVLVNARALQRNNVALDLTVNVATNDSEIIDVGNSTGYISLSGAQRHQEGYPVAAFFSKRVLSARLENGAAVDILCDDGNGRGVSCDSAPEVFIGRSLPTAFGAVSPTLTLFDRLRIHALVDFQLGHMRGDSELTGQCNAGTCEMDHYPERFDPRLVASQQLRFSNDYGLQDADFAKLREVAASYTLPASLAGRIGARSATLNVAARNLHTWTSFEGLDPEPMRLSQTYNVSNFALLPPLASFVTRIQLSF